MIVSISAPTHDTIVIETSPDTFLFELNQIAALADWGGEATINGHTIEVRYEGEPFPAWLVEVVLRDRFDFAYPAEVTPQAVPPWLDQKSWTADDRLLIRDGDHLVAEAELIAVFGEKAPGAAAMFANGARFDRYAVARVDGWLWGFVPARGDA